MKLTPAKFASIGLSADNNTVERKVIYSDLMSIITAVSMSHTNLVKIKYNEVVDLGRRTISHNGMMANFDLYHENGQKYSPEERNKIIFNCLYFKQRQKNRQVHQEGSGY